MAYKIVWKDGSSSDLEDADLENLPKEMESQIGSIDQVATTSQPSGQVSPVSPTPQAPNVPAYQDPKKSMWERFVSTNDPSQTPQTAPAIPGEYSTDPAVKAYVQKNPAKSALAVGTLYSGPIGWASAIGLPVAAEAVDKLNPFTSEKSEYSTKPMLQNAEDLFVTGILGGVGKAAGDILGWAGNKISSKLKDIASVESENAATLARNAKTASSLKEMGAQIKADAPTVFDDATQKTIRQELIESQKAMGIPKPYVTNADVRNEYIKQVTEAKGINSRIDKLITRYETGVKPVPKIIGDDGINSGMLLGGITHGLGGALVGKLLNKPAGAVIDKTLTRVVPKLPAILETASKGTRDITSGILPNVSTKTMDVFRDEARSRRR